LIVDALAVRSTHRDRRGKEFLEKLPVTLCLRLMSMLSW
jgi:hypothetical protein